MKHNIFIILITSFSIFLSSISCLAYGDLNDVENNNKKYLSNTVFDRMHRLFKDQDKLCWYPGFFITLLLAPFILLYILIAIILDIGNP